MTDKQEKQMIAFALAMFVLSFIFLAVWFVVLR